MKINIYGVLLGLALPLGHLGNGLRSPNGSRPEIKIWKKKKNFHLIASTFLKNKFQLLANKVKKGRKPIDEHLGFILSFSLSYIGNPNR